jgi:hypothetical protein
MMQSWEILIEPINFPSKNVSAGGFAALAVFKLFISVRVCTNVCGDNPTNRSTEPRKVDSAITVGSGTIISDDLEMKQNGQAPRNCVDCHRLRGTQSVSAMRKPGCRVVRWEVVSLYVEPVRRLNETTEWADSRLNDEN